jgi:hypothetical protein
MGERDARAQDRQIQFNLTAVALANKVARIVFVLMTRAAGTTVGRSRPEQTRLFDREFSPPRAISMEGADEMM